MPRKYTRYEGEWFTHRRYDAVDFEWQSYTDCTFSDCAFIGCAFEHCVFHQSYITSDTLFEGCRFHECRFTGSRSSMGPATYRGCTFQDCRLVDTNLWNVTFDDCEFPGSRLENVEFNGARGVATRVRSVDLSQAHLHYVGFVNGVDTTQMKLPATGLRFVPNPDDRFARELLEVAHVPAGAKSRQSQLAEAQHRSLVFIGYSALGQNPAVYDEAWLDDMLHDPNEAAMFESIAAKYGTR